MQSSQPQPTKPSMNPFQITWLSIFINIILALSKCFLGVWGHSRALLADGFHSILDLSSDFVTLFGLKMAQKPEDKTHHYGHHKFGTLSTLFISALLLVFCLGLIHTSIKALLVGVKQSPDWTVLIAAAISVISKEILYWRTLVIGKKADSRLLIANAWHHRADSLSSLVVFITVVLILLGGEKFYWLDSATGILLSLYLGWEGGKLVVEASADLLDTAPSSEVVDEIRKHIIPTPGAIAYHNFRVRRVGDLLEVDLHLQVDPNMTVEESHAVASQVKQNILKQHANVYNVLVHVEPATKPHLKEKGISEVRE